MDDWKNFCETSLPEKEDFHNPLNMKYVTDQGCAHSKRFWNEKIGEYDDFYFQSDTLLVFENFRNKFPEIYKLDPARFFYFTWINMIFLLVSISY